MDTQKAITAIEQHAAEFDLTPGSIGQMSVRNWRLYRNLVDGRDVQLRTIQRLFDWLEADRARRADKRASA